MRPTHRGRSRTQIPKQIERGLSGRRLEVQRANSPDDLLAFLIGVSIGETLLVIVEADQNRSGPSPSLDDDRLATLFELAQHFADGLPHLQCVHSLHDTKCDM